MNVCSVDGVCGPQVIFIFQFLVKMLKQNHKRDTWLQATTIPNLFLDGDEMLWACSAFNSTKERENAEKAALTMGYAYHVKKTTLNGTTLHVKIQNIGVAPFYPALYLQVSDTSTVSSFVQLRLPRLTPNQGAVTFDLDVISLSPPTKTSPWMLSLESDYVLRQQKVLLATQPGDDVITIA